MSKQIKIVMQKTKNRGENQDWYRIESMTNTAEIMDHKGMLHFVGCSVCHDTAQKIASNPHYQVTILAN